MRLAKLELLAYGPFRGVTVDFSAPGLHVVFGRNEAGKSTTLRAITGLLYGIDRMTSDAHLHKPADLRIGGLIEGAGGQRVHVVRRKGNANTLLDERGQPLDDAVLKKLLGGVSQETFRHAFGLDHDTLEAGAKALLDGKGDLGESLFDASVGGGGEVQRLLAELTNEADAIYKPRASALPLNEALKSFADAQKVVRERQSLPEAFLAQERALEEIGKERAAKIAAKAELEGRRTRLARGRRRVPLERRLERAIGKRAELGALVGQIARVEALKDRFAAYARAVEQRRACLAEAERLADRVAEASRRAGVEANADGLRLDARKEARVHALLRERTALSERIDASRIEVARLERELARAAELAAGPSPERLSGGEALAVAFERARALGDIDARLATERARIDRRRKDLETKALALAPIEGGLGAFVELRLPALVTVERLEDRADEIGRTLARLEERALDLEREAASLAKQVAGLAGDFAPPDVAALREARDARDHAWKALREADDASVRRTAEVEVERLLREADAVADRMIREADRVTTLARLRSEAETNAALLQKLAEEKAGVSTQLTSLEVELATLFAPAKIRPHGFVEARKWLESHGLIAASYAELVDAETELAEVERNASKARADVAAALGGEGAAPRPERLADLVAIASRRLSEIEAIRRATEEAQRSVVNLRAKLDERAAIRSRDDAAFADAIAKLAELLAPLGVPADASADEVNQSIETLRDLFSLSDQRADAEARARLADADVHAFEADLARAISDLAPDLGGMELRDAAPALFSRCQAAKENAAEITAVEAHLASEGPVTLTEDERALVLDTDAAARTEQELRERIDEIDGETMRLTERVGALRSGLEQMRADSHAAEAAADAQQALARVRENAERWCRMKLASVLLSREIERYREENQAPLLAASSSLFSRLTLGAFSGIKAGFDERDRPCLRCVRKDGTVEVDVTGLSDGTRDQLYLSLRLASLLRRAEVAESMPLVLDDVLIQLDDERASAALVVLAEVARRMQVLFFTHHARLVDLARAAVPVNELVIHELASAPSAGEAVARAPVAASG